MLFYRIEKRKMKTNDEKSDTGDNKLKYHTGFS